MVEMIKDIKQTVTKLFNENKIDMFIGYSEGVSSPRLMM